MKVRLSDLRKIVREEVARLAEAQSPQVLDDLYAAVDGWRSTGNEAPLFDVVDALLLSGDEPGLVTKRVGEVASELGLSDDEEDELQGIVGLHPGMSPGRVTEGVGKMKKVTLDAVKGIAPKLWSYVTSVYRSELPKLIVAVEGGGFFSKGKPYVYVPSEDQAISWSEESGHVTRHTASALLGAITGAGA